MRRGDKMALHIGSFEALRARFGSRSSLKLANNTYGTFLASESFGIGKYPTITEEKIIVRYHTTDIARMTSAYAILDSGGWLTSTTKERLNTIARAYGWSLHQEKGAWKLTSAQRTVYEFADNVRIFANGEILGAGEDNHKGKSK